MRIAYVEQTFAAKTMAVIRQAETICAEYRAQGYDLTLRQLYYQFVARGLIPNRDTEYKRLGSIVNDARMAGLLDWAYIVDRTRNHQANSHWSDPSSIISSAARSYRLDRWDGQETRMEVWIEKEALIGVIERPASEEDVPWFACRGYNSQSNAWRAAQRIERYLDDGAERVVVLHLGDHDPSGIDMTRDISDRFGVFLSGDGYDPYRLDIKRIALNMDQVRQYDPPPNPAKLTDSRVGGYMARYGDESWELDALPPDVLHNLITDAIRAERDEDAYEARVAQEAEEREGLELAADRWTDVVTFLEGAA